MYIITKSLNKCNSKILLGRRCCIPQQPLPVMDVLLSPTEGGVGRAGELH